MDGSKFAALSNSGVLRIWGRDDNDIGKSDMLTEVIAFAWVDESVLYTIRAVNDAEQGQFNEVLIDCSSIENSANTTLLTKCVCVTNYYWKDNVCNRNCSLKALEAGTNYDKNTCNCRGLATDTTGEC